MLYPNPKIKYYKVRTFGEKLNVAFDFLRENWKPLLKFSFYLILPICLLQSFTMNSFMRDYFGLISRELGRGSAGMNTFSFMLNYIFLMLFFLFGTCLLYGLVFTLMAAYERRDSRLMDITLPDIKPALIRNTVKMLWVYLLVFGVSLLGGALIGLLAWVSPWLGVLAAIVFVVVVVAFMIPVYLVMPIYVFEDIPLVEALRKAFRYGFAAWGQTFLVIFVVGLLSNVISGVTMTPWYLVMFLGQMLSLSEQGAGINAALWYQFVTYLLGIIQSYGMYISLVLSAVGIAFHYFHLREQNEGVSVDAGIQNFEQL